MFFAFGSNLPNDRGSDKLTTVMKRISLTDAIAAMGGELVMGESAGEITGISTDSRTIAQGDLFFALVGENSDGHNYVALAFQKGARAVVVSREVDARGSIIKVDDTLVALGNLAAWYRRTFNVRSVAITGSVGKTTTKEMVASVLGSKFCVLKNEGNFNNEIGVPFTIFQLNDEHQILVQEVGMRLPGEIAELANIVHPEIGVITNIGLSHIERLETQDAIADAKGELAEALPIDGIAVLNADDKYFERLKNKSAAQVISYGRASGDVRAENVTIDADGCASFTGIIGGVRFDVHLPLPGDHMVTNALAAISVGLCFGMTAGEIASALESMTASDKRANVVETAGGYRIIDDTYNASPASMDAALRTLASMDAQRRIAVLGDMLELGDFAGTTHRAVGKVAAESGISVLVTVGDLGQAIATGAHTSGFTGEIVQVKTSDDAAELLKTRVQSGDLVLVKGSRGMKMEKVVEALK